MAGVTLLIVSGWLAAVIFVSVGSRQEVVALAGSVDRFEELTADDFQVVRVAADHEVDVVRAGEMDELVGRVAATDLVEGALLHEDQLLDPGERVVASGEAVVGAVLAAGDSPGNIAPGVSVEVVVRPPAGSSAGPETLSGWVLEVEDTDTPGVDSQQVSLVVPASRVALVSAAAAEERVSVAVLGDS
ncbi:MAG: SAF domain-containing protein [Acidimicrobiales bacterium]